MTDARLPERWLNDRRLQRLSADHYRTFINALLWSVANRTDGRIERDDVALIPHWSANAAKAFIDAGLFTAQADGWLIADYMSTQTSRSELDMLERNRRRDREKKARQRAAKSGGPNSEDLGVGESETSSVPLDVPGDGPGEMSRGTAQAGRTGRKARKAETQAQPSLAVVNGKASGWRGAGPDPFYEYR
ncbi:hypothetical protein H7J93_14660 [Mycobacterium barrassiae]|uniref:hypothetical protein n=1 Tax=Mycobacterium barrassiae TaxID=319709 RepID=UPI002265C37E|nr:hypothetical protein [Mycobacterium barrassiae]MCV7300865.1 hypothetical protein [Mycobacterium barrassiae]